MKISAINYNLIQNFKTNINHQKTICFRGVNASDSVEFNRDKSYHFKRDVEKVEKYFLNNDQFKELEKNVPLIKQYNTFGLEEYKKLTPQEKQYLQYFTKISYTNEKSIQTDYKDLKRMYNCIKATLDKKYPKGYIFGGIGGSPSVFAKMFEYDGVKTFIFPYSRLSMDQDFNKYFDDMEYTKEYAKKLNKTVVFTDYADTGQTLFHFKARLKNFDRFNYRKNNFMSLKELILNAPQKIKNKNRLNEKSEINNLMDEIFYKRTIKSYSITPKMYSFYPEFKDNYNNINKIAKEFKWSNTAKLMQFTIIDNLKKLI